MLSKETYMRGITITQKIFLNWSFNSKDALQVQVWYEALKGIDDEDFMKVIETYCKTRIHAPTCPNDLLMILAEEEERKFPDPNQAFSKVRQLIRDNGWQYGRNDIYEAIKDNPALYETVKDMEADLRDLTTDDTYTPERFRKAYAIKLKAMCMRNRDERLRLSANKISVPVDQKVKGFLPYEE